MIKKYETTSKNNKRAISFVFVSANSLVVVNCNSNRPAVVQEDVPQSNTQKR
jgi:hypothetical protein